MSSPLDRYAPTSGTWPGQAEGPLGRITAGLHVQDEQTYWASQIAEANRTGQTLAVPVNALEAALLDYRFDRGTVRRFVFDGVEPPGLVGVISGDLAVWLASGLTR